MLCLFHGKHRSTHVIQRYCGQDAVKFKWRLIVTSLKPVLTLRTPKQPDTLQVLQSSSGLTHVNFKNRIKLRHVEQLPNTLVRPQKSHTAVLILNRSPDSY